MGFINKNKKRIAVYIDGSNFYFKLKSYGIANISYFDCRGLVEWLAMDREIIYSGYYVGVIRAKNKDKKGQQLRKSQIKLFNFLQSKKQKFTICKG